jgi:arginine N-succinyltransferase
MLVVRPADHSDLAGIEKLVTTSEARLTTLSNQRDLLSQRIELSRQSFSGEKSVAGRERFLFVMEDLSLETGSDGSVVGVAGVDACAGNGAPFYNYRKDELIHSSHQLDVHNRVPVLYMTHELTGKSQLCSLSIRREYKQGNAMELLSRTRLLFIGLFREFFSREVIVEIQGKHTEDDGSPFWDSLGRHFFDMDFKSADYFSAIKTKTFIAELMPSHPIYVPLLSAQAQAVMGKPNDAASSGYQLLLREGFRTSKHLDIFDGGPTLIARLDDIHTLKNCHYKRFKLSDQRPKGSKYMVCNPTLSDFRCVLTSLDEHEQTVDLEALQVEALKLEEDDRIAVVPF